MERFKKMKKTKGAVSIFLVLILVPMMTVSSLFVDASKVDLAKGVIESAGDLTLNSALTNYDSVLKDMYGLFATAQDTEELYGSLEEYYKTCITSSGVSNEDAGSYTDRIMSQLGLLSDGSETSDIMNMQLTDFSVQKRTDTTLANAAVLEKQIVDFMKYRAPINTGLSFISSLQSFTTLSKQTELVDKRNNYYTEQKNVMDTLKDAWGYIAQYESSPILGKDYLKTMKSEFSDSTSSSSNVPSFKSQYKNTINKNTIRDLYDTQSYTDYYCSITLETNQTVYDAKGNADTGASLWRMTYTAVSASPLPDVRDYYTSGGFNKYYAPTASYIGSLIKAFYDNKTDVEVYYDELKIAGNLNSVYDLQYLVQNMRGSLGQYTSAVANLYTTFQKLYNAMVWVEAYQEEKRDEVKKTKVDVPLTSSGGHGEWPISTYYNTFIHGEYDTIMAQAADVTRIFSDISQNLRSDITDTTKVNDLAKSISESVNDYIADFEEAADNLRSAAGKIEEARKSVEDGALATAKSEWSNLADDAELADTSIAKQDKAEIDQLGTYLNVDDMNKFITRLNSLADDLDEAAAQIKGYKFDGTFIGDIQSYDKVKSVIESHVGGAAELKSVPYIESDLNRWVDRKFSWTSGSLDLDWTSNPDTNIKLRGKGVNMHNFYSYLYTHFNDTTHEDADNGENLYNDIKSQAESDTDKRTDDIDSGSIQNSEEIKDKSNLPSANAGSDDKTAQAEIQAGEDAAANTSASLGDMFTGLANSLISMGTDLRDKLYVSDYILSMFSYDTIVKECEVNGGKVEDIKTLTLQPINAENNVAYGKEVEYIIYGESNSTNLAAAYGSIYGIRLAFNLIYAFTNSEIRDGALAIATPISAATLGVVPVPLIQAAIIIGIACCESGLDLVELRAGNEVPLFKTKETWRLSFSGLVECAKGLASEVAKEAGKVVIDEGVEKFNELLDMTDEELTKYISTGSVQLEDTVGDAYDALITRHADTAIQKLTTLATNALENIKLNTIQKQVDYVNTELDNWIAAEEAVSDPDDISLTVKKEAVNIIKSQYTEKIINALVAAKGTAANAVEDMGSSIRTKIEEIRNLITDKISTTSQKVMDYKEKMVQEVRDAASEGADKLKDKLTEKIDGIFGGSKVTATGSKTKDNTGISSLLSFSYSDYLRLFLMIGLYTNEEAVLLRTADVIQTNMAKKTGESDYQLSKSSVYVELNATVQVKPTLLALPLFADVEGNPSTDTNWYTISYNDIKGY